MGPTDRTNMNRSSVSLSLSLPPLRLSLLSVTPSSPSLRLSPPLPLLPPSPPSPPSLVFQFYERRVERVFRTTRVRRQRWVDGVARPRRLGLAVVRPRGGRVYVRVRVRPKHHAHLADQRARRTIAALPRVVCGPGARRRAAWETNEPVVNGRCRRHEQHTLVKHNGKTRLEYKELAGFPSTVTCCPFTTVMYSPSYSPWGEE